MNRTLAALALVAFTSACGGSEAITVGPARTVTTAPAVTAQTTTTTAAPLAPVAPLRVGLIGDSYAVTIAREHVPGVHWVTHARSACPLLVAPTEFACQQHHEQTAGFVGATRYDIALLVFGGGADRADACTDTTAAADIAALDSLGVIASRNGVTPLAITTIPVWRNGSQANVECTNSTIRRWATVSGATVIALDVYASSDGAPERSDGIHWFGPAAGTVGAWIVERLPRH